jgi:hypothetical protein
MIRVSLEYNYDKNSLRANEATASEGGWQIVDYCDQDFAHSFVQKMNSVLESDPLLRFKNIESLKFLLKDHLGQFLADKKSKEYAATSKNIIVLNN